MPRHKRDRGEDYTGPVWGQPTPPIWHGDGTVTLYHDDSPGMRLRVKAGLIRRTLRRRSRFATTRETLRHYKAQGIRRKKRWL